MLDVAVIVGVRASARLCSGGCAILWNARILKVVVVAVVVRYCMTHIG